MNLLSNQDVTKGLGKAILIGAVTGRRSAAQPAGVGGGGAGAAVTQGARVAVQVGAQLGAAMVTNLGLDVRDSIRARRLLVQGFLVGPARLHRHHYGRHVWHRARREREGQRTCARWNAGDDDDHDDTRADRDTGACDNAGADGDARTCTNTGTCADAPNPRRRRNLRQHRNLRRRPNPRQRPNPRRRPSRRQRPEPAPTPEPTATPEPTEPTATPEPTEPTTTPEPTEPTTTPEPTEPTGTPEPTETPETAPPAKTDPPEQPAKPWEQGRNPKRYARYVRNLNRRIKAGKTPQREPLEPEEWWNEHGSKQPNNPYGEKGTPAHQKKAQQLVDQATAEYPSDRYTVISEEPLPELPGRKPDAAVIDTQTNKTVKVYEAARASERMATLCGRMRPRSVLTTRAQAFPMSSIRWARTRPPGGVLQSPPPTPETPTPGTPTPGTPTPGDSQ